MSKDPNPDLGELIARNQETCRHEVESHRNHVCKRCRAFLRGYALIEAHARLRWGLDHTRPLP